MTWIVGQEIWRRNILGARLPTSLRSERGSALVEFSLVLPLLLLLVLPILEFGLAFAQWIDETHLANEGARWAVVDVNPGGGQTLQQYILSQSDTAAVRSNGHVCIDLPANPASGTSGQVGDPVRVTVDYHVGIPGVSSISDMLGGALPSTITVKGVSTMRLEALPSNFSAGDGGTGACT